MAIEAYLTETEAREWVRDYGGNPSWYWDAQRRSHVLVSDGVTTPGDMGVEVAAGRGDPAAVADYFVMAAQLLSVQATFAVGEARQRDSDEETFDSQADLAAAEAHQAATHEQLVDLQMTAQDLHYTAEVERIAAQEAHDDRMAELAQRNAEVNRVYHLIFNREHYASFCEGNGAREDNYMDQIWEAAEKLVDSGPTAASIKAAQDAAADAYPQPTPDKGTGDNELWARLNAAPQQVQDELWLVHPRPTGSSQEHELAVTGDPAAYTDEPTAVGYSAVTVGHPDEAGVQAYAEMLLEEARLEVGDVDGGNELLAEMAAAVAEPATQTDTWAAANPGATWAATEDPAARPTASAGKSASDVLAELLDDLDQARARLEAGDVPPERAHELVEHVEHLEGQVAARQELAARGYDSAPIDSPAAIGAESAPSTYTVDVSGPGGNATYMVSARSGFQAERDARLRYYDDHTISSSDSNYVHAHAQVNAEAASAAADQEAKHTADVAAGKSADDVLAELVADLDATGPDPYPGDDVEGSSQEHALAAPDDPAGELPPSATAELTERSAGATNDWSEGVERPAPMSAAEVSERGLWGSVAAVYPEPYGRGDPPIGYQELLEWDAARGEWVEPAAAASPDAIDGGESPGKARAADAVATAHDAVHADTHRATEDQTEQAAQARAASEQRSAAADQQSALRHGGDSHE